MHWDRLKEQLERIISAPMNMEKTDLSWWKDRIKIDFAQAIPGDLPSRSVKYGEKQYFYLQKDADGVLSFSVQANRITEKEQKLIECLLQAYEPADKNAGVVPRSEEEARALKLREFILQQIAQGETDPIPDSLAASTSVLQIMRIPLLLYGDYTESRKVAYQELKRLLESFFDSEIVLVPLLDKEWLILGAESLLSPEDDEKGSMSEESMEETLSSICSGLYDMMVSEWVGECHLSISYPIIPVKSLVETVLILRETIGLGRTYHMGKNIHVPWRMPLDRLLHKVSDKDKLYFIESVFKRTELFHDSEMLLTLAQFFELDCNVSETAKKLYIHRNTLLYRLDKFKQDTGLDVRAFGDAVLVKIALQLYKVTKRK